MSKMMFLACFPGSKTGIVNACGAGVLQLTATVRKAIRGQILCIVSLFCQFGIHPNPLVLLDDGAKLKNKRQQWENYSPGDCGK